jgi:uncharacterized membrane protein HdeD (DUF308 family)
MENDDVRHRRESRYTGVLIGSMLAVFAGILMMFTIFLAPLGLALVFGAVFVAGWAAYRRGDFHERPRRHGPRHP